MCVWRCEIRGRSSRRIHRRITASCKYRRYHVSFFIYLSYQRRRWCEPLVPRAAPAEFLVVAHSAPLLLPRQQGDSENTAKSCRRWRRRCSRRRAKPPTLRVHRHEERQARPELPRAVHERPGHRLPRGVFERFIDLKYLWLMRNNLAKLENLDENFRLHCLYLSESPHDLRRLVARRNSRTSRSSAATTS